MWIFRDGKKTVSAWKLVEELANALRKASVGDREALVDALIRAGELESALADCDSHAGSQTTALTDALARAFLGEAHALCCANQGLTNLKQVPLPREITISPPEGFAFYALSPADFAVGLRSFAVRGRPVAVIGIRSIGTTLSALALVGLQRDGAHAQRITLRPTGHPFDRVTRLRPELQRWISDFHARDAVFLVVDEGPGMSGSSFLSVAEALEREGIPTHRIYLAGSRDPNPDTLRAPNAAARWGRYHWQRVTSQVHERFRGHLFFGADIWRTQHFAENDWPACWTQMERLKFLSPARDRLYKFEGLGCFGRDARHRTQLLAEAGFSCPAENAGDGMTTYPYLQGTPLAADDLTAEILNRIGEYCAYRRKFLAEAAGNQQLQEMIAFNFEQEFGGPPPLDLESLICNRPIITDGQMHPREWLRVRDGSILKLDASTHGDDHFFPGPTDIAWDLAGAIVEWQLSSDTADLLVRRYARLAGDDPSARLPAYLLAYSVFRMGYCKMAAEAEAGSAEATRLQRAYLSYRKRVEEQVACAATL